MAIRPRGQALRSRVLWAGLAALAALLAVGLLVARRDAAAGRPAADRAHARPGKERHGLVRAPQEERRERVVPAAREEEPGPVPGNALAVRVVDAGGAPAAGVPVELRARRLAPPPDDHEDRAIAARTSDETGQAVFALADVLEASRGRRTPVVALAIPLARPVERGLEAGTLPAEPIELVLPPVGALEVIVLEADGAPFTGDAWVAVRTRMHAGERLARSEAFSGSLEAGALDPGGGRVRFDHVGLDLLLGVVAHPAGRPHAEALALGPRRAGERVEVTLRLDAAPLATARIVDEGGRPLARRRIAVRLSAGDDYAGIETRLTGEDGRVTVVADGLAERAEGELEVWAAEDDAIQAGFAAVRGPLSDGLLDLGDLVLARGPALAEGTVVDAGGAPVAGARVRLDRLRLRGGRDRRGPAVAAVTGAEGRFHVGGGARVVHARLVASHPDHPRPASLAVEDARSGLVLRLEEPRGGFVVRFEPPEALGRVVLRSIPDPDRPLRESRVSEDGELEIVGVDPGPFTLLVAADEPGRPVLATVRAVDVRAGRITRDPRLLPLDLRPHLREIVVRAVDADGRPLGVRPAVSHRPFLSGDPEEREDGGQWAQAEHWIGAAARIPHFGGPRELVVRARGRLSARLVALEGEHDVVLRPSPAIRVRVRGAPEDLPLGCVLQAYAEPLATDRESVAADVRAGEALLAPAQTGPHRVQLRLLRLGPWGEEWRGGLSASDVVLDVRAEEGERSAELAVDPEGLARALLDVQ